MSAATQAPGRVGLLGGSFNPAHGGHRRISLFAKQALGLDEVWWLVSPGNPLKPSAGMAPLAARFESARLQARRAPIRVTAIERELGTRYTVDTLGALRRRYRRIDFCWLMGSDNLGQFHRWRDWRGIARSMPIAVIARPGYEGAALASPAMAWLRRFSASAASLARGDDWSAPALVILRFDPDESSATAIRRADPDWVARFGSRSLRDQVTRRLIDDRPLGQDPNSTMEETSAR
ncbi:nicotinic acid mononucleotide adenylyltransferase [Erythrobacter sp. QSSC1-22B]|uniref:nicotinate-nucleotide adenylyltransferase n=1 Tax=Erythrobacter sp. QSSC1-22B TaxID=1860125 RepID=UPI000805215C|nr:nicotinate-nucleotide adenylyltransferase [Erythrobacter sp. QSSC1-22B]OBX19960.1 nicotinic acid mononucleotide adenylyltransferase [Erythrobacter sp. QSSC1-22B]